MSKRILTTYVKTALGLICIGSALYLILMVVSPRIKRIESNHLGAQLDSGGYTEQVKNDNSRLPDADLENIRELAKENTLV